MIHKTTRTEIREVEVTIRETVTCDICGEGVRKGRYSYDTFEGECTMSVGHSFPECGSRETTRVDICEKCFREKLIPWLQGEGAKVQVAKVDW